MYRRILGGSQKLSRAAIRALRVRGVDPLDAVWSHAHDGGLGDLEVGLADGSSVRLAPSELRGAR